jgi:hypothetical protein
METIDPKQSGHLRLEALCAELLGNGFSFEDITINFAGAFKKKFRADVEAIKVSEGDDGRDKIEMTVNRDGIYDLLPEGVFHQPIARNANAGLTQMVSDVRRQKEEEKAARRFFQPLENEFARYATFVEEQERSFASGMLSGDMAGNFTDFWGLPKGLPAAACGMLARMLPWAGIIKGDLKLTAKALQIILGKKVEGVQKRETLQQRESGFFQLNEVRLGVDMITGNCFSEPSLCWMFTISDILATEMEMYTAANPFGKLLKLFGEIFVPIEIDVIFDYKTEAAAENFSDKILGYGFTL